MTGLLDYMKGYVESTARTVESRIRGFIEENHLEWIYVDWSGGKDSTAVLASAVNCCPDKTVATFLHLAGQTHRDNVEAVLGVSRKLGLTMYKYTGLRKPRELRFKLLKDKPWEEAPALVYVITTANGMDYWMATLKYGLEAPLERFGAGKRWACSMMKAKWLAERPPNGKYNGGPARYVAVGVRRSESRYREKLWKDTTVKVFGLKYQREPDVALAPIVDLGEADVWAILEYYGLRGIVARQYEKWGRAPNCALCPLAGKNANRTAMRNLPTGYLLRVKTVLEQVREKYREGTYSQRKISEWLTLIEEELARRGGKDA